MKNVLPITKIPRWKNGGRQMKMVVTDLDRTLLKEDKTVSRYTIDVFRKLRQRGVITAIATARPKRFTEKYIREISPDAAVLHNGAVVYVEDRHLCNFSIPNSIAAKILQNASREYPEMRISVEINDALYSNFILPDPDWHSTITDFTDLPKLPVDKMLFSADDASALEAVRRALSQNFNAIIGDGWLLMVMNKNACKFSGVAEAAAHFGLTAEDIIAFGDDTNDMEMLKNCGTGVAVVNAIDEVKAIADFICDSNENDGVAKWLEKNIM
jgi:Cof subfamily protein (haloacid dehalogenase superfamily)